MMKAQILILLLLFTTSLKAAVSIIPSIHNRLLLNILQIISQKYGRYL